MFRVKICGITSQADAVCAAAAGADAIGLNFYAGSPRCVTPLEAHEIVGPVSRDVVRVGVFVNESADTIRLIAEQLALDYIQLHGDEPVTMVSQLAPLRVIRAFRAGSGFRQQVRDYLEASGQQASQAAAILIDAFEPGTYGGTGKTVDWHHVHEFVSSLKGARIILAGGLSPSNVEQAIRLVQPQAVDVASGVESAPGRKDDALVQAFVMAARRGFGSRDDLTV